jgi:hypothetical protein
MAFAIVLAIIVSMFNSLFAIVLLVRLVGLFVLVYCYFVFAFMTQGVIALHAGGGHGRSVHH